jgi:hypothetical protein
MAALLAAALCLGWSAEAAAQIKQPGAHARYSLELEPHLFIQHHRSWFGDDEGFGPGVRFSIPLVHNGPIPTINNNFGISVGLDWAMFNDCDGRFTDDDCDVDHVWIPVVFQWNFFFTRVVSVFGEVGPAIVYRSISLDGGCPSFGGDCDDDDLELFEPVFWGGGRFLFSDSVGLVVRLGTPAVTVGATFLL